MQPSSIVNSLNVDQAQAVTSDAHRLLVLAGAGSGKTRVLVHRIAWLIQERGLSPHSILAVTFTNKAAAEMRQRIEQLLRAPAGSMWVGTFHGLAHRLLRTHHELANLPANFQILDADDQLRLVKRILRQLELDDTTWPPRQAQAFINSQKDEGLRPQHIETGGDRYQQTLTEVYREYQAACDRGGLVDFAELLLRSHELWLHQPQLLDHYRRRFRHILVDEFQDISPAQYDILRILVVGFLDNVIPISNNGDEPYVRSEFRGNNIRNIEKAQSCQENHIKSISTFL